MVKFCFHFKFFFFVKCFSETEMLFYCYYVNSQMKKAAAPGLLPELQFVSSHFPWYQALEELDLKLPQSSSPLKLSGCPSLQFEKFILSFVELQTNLPSLL